MLAAANWQRGGKGPRPKPLQRPDPREEARRRALTRRAANLGLLDNAPPATEASPDKT